MTIQWSAPSFTGGIGVSITGYVIYRQENIGAWTEEGVVGGSTFTFNQNTLVNGRYYNYRVAAYNNGSRHPTPPEFNQGGEGANSTIVNGRPITVPGAVATILTTLVVDSGLELIGLHHRLQVVKASQLMDMLFIVKKMAGLGRARNSEWIYVLF
jgi:hypothetical protein